MEYHIGKPVAKAEDRACTGLLESQRAIRRNNKCARCMRRTRETVRIPVDHQSIQQPGMQDIDRERLTLFFEAVAHFAQFSSLSWELLSGNDTTPAQTVQ